jgi:early secretory antigenic target protein ESAT-6
MSDGHMLVTFGALSTAESDARTIAGQIDATLDDLRAYLAPMVSTWSGSAATEYNGLQSQWDTAAAELNTVLRTIADALRTANENYGEAERTNTGMWT